MPPPPIYTGSEARSASPTSPSRRHQKCNLHSKLLPHFGTMHVYCCQVITKISSRKSRLRRLVLATPLWLMQAREKGHITRTLAWEDVASVERANLGDKPLYVVRARPGSKERDWLFEMVSDPLNSHTEADGVLECMNFLRRPRVGPQAPPLQWVTADLGKNPVHLSATAAMRSPRHYSQNPELLPQPKKWERPPPPAPPPAPPPPAPAPPPKSRARSLTSLPLSPAPEKRELPEPAVEEQPAAGGELDLEQPPTERTQPIPDVLHRAIVIIEEEGQGLGLNWSQQYADGQFCGPLICHDVTEGSPAAVAGLSAGALIETVNGLRVPDGPKLAVAVQAWRRTGATELCIGYRTWHGEPQSPQHRSSPNWDTRPPASDLPPMRSLSTDERSDTAPTRDNSFAPPRPKSDPSCRCGLCGSSGVNMPQCACRSISYCNKVCQQSDWARHSVECVKRRGLDGDAQPSAASAEKGTAEREPPAPPREAASVDPPAPAPAPAPVPPAEPPAPEPARVPDPPEPPRAPEPRAASPADETSSSDEAPGVPIASLANATLREEVGNTPHDAALLSSDPVPFPFPPAPAAFPPAPQYGPLSASPFAFAASEAADALPRHSGASPVRRALGPASSRSAPRTYSGPAAGLFGNDPPAPRMPAASPSSVQEWASRTDYSSMHWTPSPKRQSSASKPWRSPGPYATIPHVGGAAPRRTVSNGSKRRAKVDRAELELGSVRRRGTPSSGRSGPKNAVGPDPTSPPVRATIAALSTSLARIEGRLDGLEEQVGRSVSPHSQSRGGMSPEQFARMQREAGAMLGAAQALVSNIESARGLL